MTKKKVKFKMGDKIRIGYSPKRYLVLKATRNRVGFVDAKGTYYEAWPVDVKHGWKKNV